MENIKNFVEELSVILETKRNEFNSQILPKVRENYNIQSSALHAVRNTLLKKRVIHDDPYKYDSKMTEVEIPSKENFADSEKSQRNRNPLGTLRNNAGICQQLLSV
ncbi:hypothetical protein [Treponema sp. OMZ 788]|uniref:hypothetical protein n=1 Tax=Treponema sp. OMZ 788 TaxID=2563664 RepID=UPI0020A5E9B2|nr:hypothetical protein [Treponema sp. OMZ 788]